MASRIYHIGEHHRRPTKHIVLKFHARVDGDVVLDLHIVSDGHTRTDHHVLSEIAVFTQLGLGHNVCEVPDLGPLADFTRLINHGSGVSNVTRLVEVHRDGLSPVTKRLLATLKNAEDTHSARAVRAGLLTARQTIEE